MECCRDRFRQLEAKYFDSLGRLVARNTKIIILVSVILTVSATSGVYWFKAANDARLDFLPLDSHGAHHEWPAFLRFYNITRIPRIICLNLYAADWGSMIRPEQLQAAINILKLVRDHRIEYEGNIITFKDACIDCSGFDDFLTFMFTNVTVTADKLTIPDGWSTAIPTNMKAVYRIGFDSLASDKSVERRAFAVWELSLFALLQNTSSDIITSIPYGENNLNKDLDDCVTLSATLLPLSTLCVLGYILLTLLPEFKDCQSTKRAILVASAALISPTMAVLSTFGVYLWLGYALQTLQSIIPCLVLGIGVDDAFLLVSSWKHHLKNKTFRRLPREDRMAIIFVNVGPSLTITSITNTASLAIGILIDIPNCQMFCIVASIAVFVDYVLEISFFAAFMLEVYDDGQEVELEDESETHSQVDFNTVKPFMKQGSPDSGYTEDDVFGETGQPFVASKGLQPKIRQSDASDLGLLEGNPKQQQQQQNNDHQMSRADHIVLAYSNLLLKWPIRIILTVIYLVIIFFGAYGFSTFPICFQPTEYMPENTLSMRSIQIYESVWSENFDVTLFIDRPPILSNSTDMKLFDQMMEEFDNLPQSYGRKRHLNWLRTYRNWLMERSKEDEYDFFGLATETNNKSHEVSYALVTEFLESHPYWSPMINVDIQQGVPTVTSFFTRIFFHEEELVPLDFKKLRGSNLRYDDRLVFMVSSRDVALRYPEFGVNAWNVNLQAYDILRAVPHQLISILLTVITVTLAMLALFVPDFMSMVFVAITIFVINICQNGYHYFRSPPGSPSGISPMMLLCFVTTAGLTVDYTVHTVVHYARSSHIDDKAERIRQTLSLVAKPLIQAGGSTIVAVLPMIQQDTAAFDNFLITLSFIVVLGLFHALCLLPMFMSMMPTKKKL